MTRYILHGGATRRNSEYNYLFFKRIVEDLPNGAKILLVYFAREEEAWTDLFKAEKEKFTKSSTKKFQLILASKNLSTFIKQIKDANAIYIRGGDTNVLQKYLEKIKDLKELLRGKVVAGSSAGAYILSKYYYTNNDNKIKKGLNILPIKIICHFSKKLNKQFYVLKNYKENINTYALEEEKFIVVDN